ncbi:hypothetical protein C1H46_034971 [Malus baccata]|uniref:Uncharacterized protein n=1 Tax=Malus baccata TaxID=106549 RepID=A0A540KZ23_MALBA|nr:hypothetical protein C1H46_034971 [Malus baccata]
MRVVPQDGKNIFIQVGTNGIKQCQRPKADMKAEPITTTKYAKRRNCIWRTTRNPLMIMVVGKFVKGVCYLKIHLKK